jgi:hypothetical protein
MPGANEVVRVNEVLQAGQTWIGRCPRASKRASARVVSRTHASDYSDYSDDARVFTRQLRPLEVGDMMDSGHAQKVSVADFIDTAECFHVKAKSGVAPENPRGIPQQ